MWDGKEIVLGRITMNEYHEVYSKIDEVSAVLDNYHSRMLQEGIALKDKLDTMENRVADELENKDLENELTVTSEQLDILVDSLILVSGRLDKLKDSCRRIEDLMTSLLCYSLSRFRKIKAE